MDGASALSGLVSVCLRTVPDTLRYAEIRCLVCTLFSPGEQKYGQHGHADIDTGRVSDTLAIVATALSDGTAPRDILQTLLPWQAI